MPYLTNEQIANLVSRALTKVQEHDEREGGSADLDEAMELLQKVCDGIEL